MPESEFSAIFDNEYNYLSLLEDIMDKGVACADRTGVGTKAVLNRQLTFDLTRSFPLMTTRALPWPMIPSELLWFIEGSQDERRLAEIRYGKDRSELTDKKTIWTANAKSSYWLPNAGFDGDLGRVYGVQWRDWRTPHVSGAGGNCVDVEITDQLSGLIAGIRKDPYGRRHILTAWNPGELSQMALPPCHLMSIFNVLGDELSCMQIIRSWDTVLGAPVNIASYALFTMMVAQVCGLKAKELTISGANCHIYSNHFAGVEELLKRKPQMPPTVILNPAITEITDFTMEDITLHDYNPLPAIKNLPMAV